MPDRIGEQMSYDESDHACVGECFYGTGRVGMKTDIVEGESRIENRQRVVYRLVQVYWRPDGTEFSCLKTGTFE